jgi:hypothetical protein
MTTKERILKSKKEYLATIRTSLFLKEKILHFESECSLWKYRCGA